MWMTAVASGPVVFFGVMNAVAGREVVSAALFTPAIAYVALILGICTVDVLRGR
jgi:hypothetical protein